MTFDRRYFESDDQSIGYRGEGYRDFAVHWKTVEKIMEKKPQSLLDLGGARGYIAKKIKYQGGVSKVVVVDSSEHCFHTRAYDDFVLHNIEDTPYPFPDKEFDLVFSDSVLEHIHYDKIDAVIREISRISKRSYHGIGVQKETYDRKTFEADGTHYIYETLDWWKEKFKENCKGHHEFDLSDNISNNESVVIPGDDYIEENGVATRLKKVNLGSFINMFHFGWDNLDIIQLQAFADKNGYRFIQHDLSRQLPYSNGSVDFIFTSHTLEHLEMDHVRALIKECYRILSGGGIIRIAVPDAELLMKSYIRKRPLDYLKHISPKAERGKTQIEKLGAVMLDNHKSLLDFETLNDALVCAGFSNVSICDPFSSSSEILEAQTIVSHPTISLVLEARK